MTRWSEAFLSSGALLSGAAAPGAAAEPSTSAGADAGGAGAGAANGEEEAVAGAELFLRLLGGDHFEEELARVVAARYPSERRTNLDEALVATVVLAPEHAAEVLRPLFPHGGDDSAPRAAKRRRAAPRADAGASARDYSPDAPPFSAFIALFSDGGAGAGAAQLRAARAAVLGALHEASASSAGCERWLVDCLAAAPWRVAEDHFLSVFRSDGDAPLRRLAGAARRTASLCALEAERHPGSSCIIIGTAVPALAAALAAALADAARRGVAPSERRVEVREALAALAAPLALVFGRYIDTEWAAEVLDALLSAPEDEDPSGGFSALAVLPTIVEGPSAPGKRKQRFGRAARVVDALLRRCEGPESSPGRAQARSARRAAVRVLGSPEALGVRWGGDDWQDAVAQFRRWLVGKGGAEQEAVCRLLPEAWAGRHVEEWTEFLLEALAADGRRLSEVFLRLCAGLGADGDGSRAFRGMVTRLMQSEAIDDATRVDIVLELLVREKSRRPISMAAVVSELAASAVSALAALVRGDGDGAADAVRGVHLRRLEVVMAMLAAGGDGRCARVVERLAEHKATRGDADAVVESPCAPARARVLCAALRSSLSAAREGECSISHAAAMDVAVAAGARALHRAYLALVSEDGGGAPGSGGAEEAAALLALRALLREDEHAGRTVARMLEAVDSGARASDDAAAPERVAGEMELSRLLCVHSPGAAASAVAAMRASLRRRKVRGPEGRTLVMGVLEHVLLRAPGGRRPPGGFAACAEAVLEPLSGHYAESLHAEGELDLLPCFAFFRRLSESLAGDGDEGGDATSRPAPEGEAGALAALISRIGPRIVMLLCDPKAAGLKLTARTRAAGIDALAAAAACARGGMRSAILDAFASRFSCIRAAGGDGCSIAVARGLQIDVAELE